MQKNSLKVKTVSIILPFPLKETYTYFVPNDLIHRVEIGKRVIVSFGSKRYFTGIICEIAEISDISNLKPIVDILDEKPIVTPITLKFWNRLSDYYLVSLGDIFKAAIPSILRLESTTTVRRLDNKSNLPSTALSPKEQQLLDLIDNSGEITVSELEKIVSFRTLPILNSMLEKKVVQIEEKIDKKYSKKKVDYIYASFDTNDKEKSMAIIESLKRAKKQVSMLHRLIELANMGQDNKEEVFYIRKDDFLKQDDFSLATLKALINKNILAVEQKTVSRITFDNQRQSSKPLSSAQEKALADIKNALRHHRTSLLWGVTSSGKTEIYVHLIKEALAKGQTILYLVPEIGLTTQLVDRLKSIFGVQLLVYHSRMSQAERVEVREQLLNGTPCVVIGVRSSIFLPFINLALIIVDEEHDSSYIQTDPSPRYNTKIAVAFLAQIFDSRILLGSATPSIKSFSLAKAGRIGLIELPVRYDNIDMPTIDIIDLKDAYRRKQMKGHFSLRLIKAIEETISKTEQVIIFQNRRGYSLNLECRSCGFVPKCKRCDVSMTLHKRQNILSCHYCGYKQQNIYNCPQCRTNSISYSGFGTEQLEEETKKLFPHLNIGRLDFDTTRRKQSFEKIVNRFEKHDYDIIIGTQMVAKGLDFSNVGLVAVMNADNLMNFPDFYAHETAFQTLVQISGRAGRKHKGRVAIQTYSPKHSLIEYVAHNDYLNFFYLQMHERQLFRYPPYCRLIMVTFKHRNEIIVDKASHIFAKDLYQFDDFEVLGPDTPPISKIEYMFRRKIILKISNKTPWIEISSRITNAKKLIEQDKECRSVGIVLEID